MVVEIITTIRVIIKRQRNHLLIIMDKEVEILSYLVCHIILLWRQRKMKRVIIMLAILLLEIKSIENNHLGRNIVLRNSMNQQLILRKIHLLMTIMLIGVLILRKGLGLKVKI
jgi:hypothetical protein